MGFPITTAVLTKEGWKDYDDFLSGNLLIGEEIRVFNYEEEEMIWAPLIGVCYQEEPSMFSLDTPRGTLYSTEEHPWLIHQCGLEFYQTIKLQDIDFSRDNHGLNNIGPYECKPTRQSYWLRLGFNTRTTVGPDIDNDLISMSRVEVSSSESQPAWNPITEYRTVWVKQDEAMVLSGSNNEIECGTGAYPTLPSVRFTDIDSNNELNSSNSEYSFTLSRSNSITTDLNQPLDITLLIDSPQDIEVDTDFSITNVEDYTQLSSQEIQLSITLAPNEIQRVITLPHLPVTYPVSTVLNVNIENSTTYNVIELSNLDINLN